MSFGQPVDPAYARKWMEVMAHMKKWVSEGKPNSSDSPSLSNRMQLLHLICIPVAVADGRRSEQESKLAALRNPILASRARFALA